MGINMVITWSIFASPFFWTGYLVGGFNASEKYESQLGLLFPIYGKIKNVPNHQPGYIMVMGQNPGAW